MNIHWNFHAFMSCLARHGLNQAAGSALSGASLAMSEKLEMSQKKIFTFHFLCSLQSWGRDANPAVDIRAVRKEEPCPGQAPVSHPGGAGWLGRRDAG